MPLCAESWLVPAHISLTAEPCSRPRVVWLFRYLETGLNLVLDFKGFKMKAHSHGDGIQRFAMPLSENPTSVLKTQM